MARTMQTASKSKRKISLHNAVLKGDVARVTRLLPQPNINVNKIKDKLTPLMLACKFSRAEIVDELLAHSNIDVNVSPAEDGETALMIACSKGHAGIVRSLLATKHINLNETDKKRNVGYTALMYAAAQGYTDVVRALLDHKDIDVNITSTKHGFTALMCAVQFDNTDDTVTVLLAHKDIDTKVLSKKKQTALELTVSQGIRDAILEHEARQGTYATSSREQPQPPLDLTHTPPPPTASSTARTHALTASVASAASTHTADSASSDEGEREEESEEEDWEEEGWENEFESKDELEETEESEWVMGGRQQPPPGRTVHLRTSAFLVDSPFDNSRPAAQLDISVVAADSVQEKSKKRPHSSITETTETCRSAAQQAPSPVRAATLAKSSVVAASLVPVSPAVSPAVSPTAPSTVATPVPFTASVIAPAAASSSTVVAAQPSVPSAPTSRPSDVAAPNVVALASTAAVPSSVITSSLPPTAPGTPHIAIIDHSSRNWLTDRMAKTGYSKKIVEECHQKLVEEQGFVQESLFAELTDDDLNANYFGITGKGTQLFLTRLHRELRAQYFPRAVAASSVPAAVLSDKDAVQVEPATQRPRLA